MSPMPAEWIDGKAIARMMTMQVRAGLQALRPHRPCLVSLSVGDDPASALYIRNQRKACEAVGIDFQSHHLPAEISELELASEISRLNLDPAVTAIILQRPLPQGIHQHRMQALIDPAKDVEGLNPASLGCIVCGEPRLAPCTAAAAVRCVRSTGTELRGKEVVVVGHSEIVGKPIAFLMLNHFATTTICHIATQDLAAHVRRADILFAAVGKPGLIRGPMVRPGAIVIDIGICQVPMVGPDGAPLLDTDGRPRIGLAGDVEAESVRQVASFLTPVPGGVGPVTVASLLRNVLLATRLQLALEIDPEEFAI
ncbi:MAG: bifunctional 5,10-methylenetetrahydrofolate dehydrogenase/5,10-methenyltetrahydrofolate cyclohydrolase [Planctomycetota bacterium]